MVSGFMTNEIQIEQVQIVEELLRRQDEALEQISALNERVEQVIAETLPARSTEDAAESSDSGVEQEDLEVIPAAA